MNKLFLLLLIAAAGCGNGAVNSANDGNRAAPNAAQTTANANRVPPKPYDISRAFFGQNVTAEERIAAIEKYVEEIETRLATDRAAAGALQRREIALKPGSLKDATAENWAKLEVYADGTTIKRLKVYAADKSGKSEEFYFYDDQPIFVSIEPDEKSSPGGNRKTTGDKFYFGDEGLLAWTRADGTPADPGSEEFKRYAAKLKKEATAFKNAK